MSTPNCEKCGGHRRGDCCTCGLTLASAPSAWSQLDESHRTKVLNFLRMDRATYEEFGTRFYNDDANEMIKAFDAAIAVLENK